MEAQTEVIDREDQRGALDRFANASTNSPLQPMSQLVRPTSSVAERIVGAQEVAVYRDDARILQKIAALGSAAGGEWFYRFPVRKKGGGTDYVEGPSIKLANDVARIYGNCSIEVREIDVGDAWVFYARFTDIESGFSMERAFRQRKSQSAMKTDADRALDIAYQIGQSKAIRNVITNGLQTYCDYAFDAARNSLVEKIGKNLEAWRQRTIEGVAKIPVDLVRVESVLGRAAKEWTAPDVAKVIAMMKSIHDGMATLDETFPPIGAAQAEPEQTAEDDKTDLDKFSEQASTRGGNGADQSPASGQPAPEPSSSQSAGQSGAGNGPAAEQQQKGAGDQSPATSAAYIAAAQAWIEAMTDPDAGEARWKSEKGQRNKLNVSPEVRDQLEGSLKAKVAALRGAKG